MARPSKTTEVLKNEQKSHRTKAELNQRATAEKSARTGIKMREFPETKADPIAHTEFRRVRKIFQAISEDDALYEATINDYCLFKSTISRYIAMRDEVEREEGLKASERLKLMLECEKYISAYTKKRQDIEKENGMTISSAARTVPKTVTKKPSALAQVLGNK